MKKYIQITAGRGPVECARAVTLIAREILKAIPVCSLRTVSLTIMLRIAICR